MKLPLLFACIFSTSFAFAQQAITITSSDMPTVNDTFRYSITDNLAGIINLDDNGTNQVWDYSMLGSFDQRIDTLVDPVFGTPLIYNVTFSNIFDLNHFATLAHRNNFGQFGQGFIDVQNVFDFYRTTNSYYANVGSGMTINSVPLTSLMEPRDMIWEFPLEFGDTDESFGQFGFDIPTFGYFGQKIWRTNTVDGWGELTTRYGTFNTIRVTTILDITDTISAQGFGFETPRPTEFEVKWLTNDERTSVLTVKGRINFGEMIINSVEYLDSARGFTLPGLVVDPTDTTDTTTSSILEMQGLHQLTVWPNPVNQRLNIGFTLQEPMTLKAELFDVTGKAVLNLGQREFKAGDFVWTYNLESSLGSGLYQLVLTNQNGLRKSFRVVKTE